MSKRTFIVFGIFVVVLVIVIPWLVFRDRGDAKTGVQSVPASLQRGQSLFQINCGTCHTLYAAGTNGNFAPDLDELLAPSGPPSGPSAASTIKSTESRVLNAVEHGFNSSAPGRMPPGILNPTQAKEVAEFVAHVAGEG